MNKFISLLLLLVSAISLAVATPQSNYELQGLDVPYGEPGLPPNVTLEGKVTPFDTLQPDIVLNRTTANLNCEDGSMKVLLQFKELFYGLAYSDFDRNSACYAQGTGTTSVILELPLKGCGTIQDPPRVFTNNVIVRFHPGLEMEGDEVITIVCRYPPPIVPLPPERIFVPPAAIVPAGIAPFREFEILLVICAILFLGLMLLGLGCSYYCLRQRNIQVIRKRPFSPIEEESEKLSTIESFANLKIPRVHAPSTESSSEIPPEETLASDYPSSIEDAPQRPDTVSSEYSDTHAHIEVETIPLAMVKKPQFEVNLRVAEQPETMMQFSEREESLTSVEEGVAQRLQTEELHAPPRKRAPPPVFRKIQELREPKRSVQDSELIDTLTVVDRDEVDRQSRYTQPVVVRKPELSVHTVDDVYLQTIVERKLIEDEERRTREITQFYKKEQPKWDVTIRAHPETDDEAWERGSETTDVASSIGWSAIEESPIRPRYSVVDRDLLSRRTDVTRHDQETTTVSRTMQKLQQDDTRVWNEKWKVLFRVLETPPPHEVVHETDYDSETSSILTETDREKWRQIITKESTLRSLLTQATVREDYERIRRDTRYEKLFEPQKWDVIIRVLAPPEEQPSTSSDRFFSDNTSEVSSAASYPTKPQRLFSSRKRSSDTVTTTTGEMKSITDVRSMTEMMIDFAATDVHYSRDDESILSSIPGGPRSVADRSQTEIVEFAPLDEDDGSVVSDIAPTLSALRSQLDSRGGSLNRGFTTEEQSVSHQVDESEGFVQQSTVSSSRKTFTSSSSNRLTRF